MGVEHEQADIDKQQKRIDLFDDKEDKKVSDKTPNFVFSRLDEFQKTIRESKEPEEVKVKQLKALGDLLNAAKIEGLDQLDKDLESKIKTFETGLVQFENKELHQVKSGDNLGKIVQEKLHIDIGSNPKLFFAGIKALQEYRNTHGSVLKISSDASITWDKGNASLEQLALGEYLDLSVLNGLTANDTAGMDYYIEKSSNETFKKGIRKLRDTIKTPDVAAEVKAIAAELPKPNQESTAASVLKKPEEVQQLIDSRLMEDFADVDTMSMGFGKIKTRDEFQKTLDGITTDAQMKEFLASITDGLQAEQEAGTFKATEQQKMRLEQVDLITDVVMGISELFKESGGVTMKFVRFAGGKELSAQQAKEYVHIAENFKTKASEKVLRLPDQSLEQSSPEMAKLIQMFRGIGEGAGGTESKILTGIMGIPSIDFKDPQNERDMNLQRAQVMSFLASVGSYQTVEKIGKEALKEDFDKAKAQTPEDKKTEITQAAKAKIAGNAAQYKEQWKAQNMTDAQIAEFLSLMEAEQVEKDLNSYALLNNFDPNSISEDKKAVWAVYNDTFDPKNEWFNMTSAHWDTVVEEVLINAPLIILSGGAASLARAGLSTATRAFLASSTLARYSELGASAVAAYDAGNVALRGAAIVGGTLTEGTAFEATHNVLSVQLGLEDKYLYEMPDAMQKILWSSISLGAFHGAGKLAEGVGKGIDEGLAVQVQKLRGLNPNDLKAVNAIAENISNTATRKVIQELVISGNIEAATMLAIGAVQNGYYKGNLQEFKDNFGEELFHAYVSVGALKTSGHITGHVMGEMGKEFKTKIAEKDIPGKVESIKDDFEHWFIKFSTDISQRSKSEPESKAEEESTVRSWSDQLMGFKEQIQSLIASMSVATDKIPKLGLQTKIDALIAQFKTALQKLYDYVTERNVNREETQPEASPKQSDEPASTEAVQSKEVTSLEELRTSAETKKTPDEELHELSQQGEQSPISKEILKDAWFKVEHKEKIGDNTFFFGPVIEGTTQDDRPECIAFVKTSDGQLYPRLFYLSNSDGGWRACPAMRPGQGGYEKGSQHYTQGTRPAEEITRYLEGAMKKPTTIGRNASDYFDASKGADIFNILKIYDIYRGEVTASRPENLKDLWSIPAGAGDNYKLEINKLSSADLISRIENIKYPDGFVPKFSEGYVHKYTKNHTILGEGTVYVYEANLNGRKVEWHMARYGNEISVDAIRYADSPISSFGNYSEVIDSGILTSKPIEYKSQVYGINSKEGHTLYNDLNPNSPNFKSGYVDQTPLLDHLKPIRDFRSQFTDKQRKAA